MGKIAIEVYYYLILNIITNIIMIQGVKLYEKEKCEK